MSEHANERHDASGPRDGEPAHASTPREDAQAHASAPPEDVPVHASVPHDGESGRRRGPDGGEAQRASGRDADEAQRASGRDADEAQRMSGRDGGEVERASGRDGGEAQRMSLLERRYRSTLRLLPASYRAGREEEMVAAFMELSGDVPDEDDPRPRWGEIASVLALSARVRLGAAGATPGQVARGAAVRLFALLGMGATAAFSMVDLVRAALLGSEPALIGAPESAARLAFIGVLAAAGCSIVAFVTLMRGHVRTAKVAALVSLVPSLTSYALSLAQNGSAALTPLHDLGNLLFLLAPPLALLIGFHSDVTPHRHSWPLTLSPLVAGAALMGLTMSAIAAGSPEPMGYYLWLDYGAAIPAWAAASAVVLARRQAPSRALALSAAGLVLLATRLPMLAYLPDVMWATAVVQCALLGTLTMALGTAGTWALSRSARPVARP
ncbi:hypothetical protein GCM10009850_055970 [Nonomuraea monospora]|uniref:Uncharacterized protein n=1 Tax=Nonomuraea monospora TaxID=568818 RepID=A0ABN3CKY5_9ACTN